MCNRTRQHTNEGGLLPNQEGADGERAFAPTDVKAERCYERLKYIIGWMGGGERKGSIDSEHGNTHMVHTHSLSRFIQNPT